MEVKAACALSFRTVATTLNDLTGLNLSRKSIWRIVQSAGEWEQSRVEGLAAAVKAECGARAYETPVLLDGVYLDLQGKGRLEYGPSKEMKVSIAYSGVYEDTSGRLLKEWGR